MFVPKFCTGFLNCISIPDNYGCLTSKVLPGGALDRQHSIKCLPMPVPTHDDGHGTWESGTRCSKYHLYYSIALVDTCQLVLCVPTKLQLAHHHEQEARQIMSLGLLHPPADGTAFSRMFELCFFFVLAWLSQSQSLSKFWAFSMWRSIQAFSVKAHHYYPLLLLCCGWNLPSFNLHL